MGLAGFVIGSGEDSLPPTPGWDIYFLLLNFVVGLLLLLSLYAVLSGVRVWFRDVGWATKARFSLVALACLFLSWFSIHWHLIGQIHRI